MTESTFTVDASDGGELLITTGVTGRASKMGHSLTIAMTAWQGTVEWSADGPASVTLTTDVDSLEVKSGEGGVTPSLGPEKMLARSNALKTFDAKRFPLIRFHSDDITATANGYRLIGELQIHGKTRDHAVDVAIQEDGPILRVSCESTVTQTLFGISPYSQLLGAMKVVDDVTVTFTAEVPQQASAG